MKLIVALIDFSEVTSDVITLTGDIARATNGNVLLLHVRMPDADFVDGKLRENVSRTGIAALLRKRHHDLHILEAALKKLGINARAMMVRSTSLRGNPAAKIVAELHRRTPDLVVMGSHGHGRLYQLLVGSVTDAVVRQVRVPVLLVPSPRPKRKR